jgi:hypothetical protein
MNIQPSPKVVVARAVKQMCPALREQYDSARRLLSSAASSDARARYRVGTIVAEIKKREDRYGTRAVTLLATALGRDETTLYRYATVAETWSESALADLLLKRMPCGEPLSWSHLLELAAIASPEHRERLIQEALNEGLSVRALAALGRGEWTRGGHRAALPPSLSRLERIIKISATAEKRFSLDNALLDALIDGHIVDAALVVGRAVAAQEKVLQTIEANLAKLRRAESKLVSNRAIPLRAPSARKSGTFPRLLVGMTG